MLKFNIKVTELRRAGKLAINIFDADNIILGQGTFLVRFSKIRIEGKFKSPILICF